MGMQNKMSATVWECFKGKILQNFDEKIHWAPDQIFCPRFYPHKQSLRVNPAVSFPPIPLMMVTNGTLLWSFSGSTCHGRWHRELRDLLKVLAQVGAEWEPEPRLGCSVGGVLSFSAIPAEALCTFILLQSVTKSFLFFFEYLMCHLSILAELHSCSHGPGLYHCILDKAAMPRPAPRLLSWSPLHGAKKLTLQLCFYSIFSPNSTTVPCLPVHAFCWISRSNITWPPSTWLHCHPLLQMPHPLHST